LSQPPTKFVIVAMRRTASTYLVQMLGNHPEIHCCGEIFIPEGVGIRWPEERGGRRSTRELESELKTQRGSDPDAFLARVFALDFQKPAVGFKMFRSHHPAMFERILDDRSILKIVHFRANVLARYASNLAARMTGNFGRYAVKPPVTFDAAEFTKFHNEQAAFYDGVLRHLAASGQSCHLSRFDEINNDAARLGLFKFLGAAPITPPLPEKPAVMGGTDTLSRFSNAKEARAFLRERGLLHWAREGETSFAPI
jgi:Sulfotransferase family